MTKSGTTKREHRIGVVSDTHGHLPPGLKRVFAGVGHILHAGDVGKEQVLQGLEAMAPVTAVRGNMDRGEWARRLPWEMETEVDGVCITLGHIEEKMNLRGRREKGKPLVVVSGHTHVSEVRRVGTTLFLNPGSAGRGRHGSGRSVAILTICAGEVDARLIPLEAE